MFSQSMYQLGAKRSCIRELFEYGLRQAKVVGPENVFDFSMKHTWFPPYRLKGSGYRHPPLERLCISFAEWGRAGCGSHGWPRTSSSFLHLSIPAHKNRCKKKGR